MPTYEFRCPQGHEFEKLYRTISGAEAQALCPQCAQPAERVMSAVGFSFKGSGFYLTDYGKNAHRDKGTAEPKSGAPAGEGGASESAKPDAKSESTGESKGESKAESKAEAAPTSGAAKSGSAAPDAKKPEPKATPKPAAEPAKKSSSE
jgi:putative FmdB family regulatory protein